MTEILKAEDILQKRIEIPDNSEVSVPKNVKCDNVKENMQEDSSDSEDDGNFKTVRGRIVSGRFWKTPKNRANSVIKTPGLRRTFAQKQKFREEMKRVKELSRALQQERLDAKLEKKRRREENLRRAEENRKKNEIVQAIKDTAKIKKMKRSQLRQIEKRDVTQVDN